jgi:hypothetical protein
MAMMMMMMPTIAVMTTRIIIILMRLMMLTMGYIIVLEPVRAFHFSLFLPSSGFSRDAAGEKYSCKGAGSKNIYHSVS